MCPFKYILFFVAVYAFAVLTLWMSPNINKQKRTIKHNKTIKQVGPCSVPKPDSIPAWRHKNMTICQKSLDTSYALFLLRKRSECQDQSSMTTSHECLTSFPLFMTLNSQDGWLPFVFYWIGAVHKTCLSFLLFSNVK